MRDIKVLDCTLRDGGYVNNWYFGKENIKKIITNLNKSNVDIIECGFLRDDIDKYDKNYSLYKYFNDLLSLGKSLFKYKKKKYVLMLLTEKCDVNNLEFRNQSYVDTIRLSFHKKDMKKALNDAKEILRKGYNLFLQPTATMRYSDDEILELIKVCNKLKPLSVAIVDSFGEMLDENIIHLAQLFDNNLDKDIYLSFHSHNNIQTAFSNTMLFIKNTSSNRNIIVDSSVYGMGRGAGNLCSELIIDYLNKNYDMNYKLSPLLEIADNILEKIKKYNYWGYSIEYCLSAINHCHPNYCIYFNSKKTLTTNDLERIVNLISEDKKSDFDKTYADELYLYYCSGMSYKDDESYERIKKIIKNKKIILIGSGKSISSLDTNIKNMIDDKDNYFTIAINNKIKHNSDAYFVSNRKRYDNLKINSNTLYLFTSNINDNKVAYENKVVFDYGSLVAKEIEVSDNSLLLMINILKKIYHKHIYLIGFDGFDYDQYNNFYDESLLYLIDKNRVDKMNNSLKEYIKLYRNEVDITFLTKSKYE